MPEETTPQQPNPIPSVKSGLNWLHVLIGVVVGALLVGGGFLVYNAYQSKPTVSTTPTVSTSSAKITPQTSPPATKDETADWKTFNGNGFNFKYPKEWEFQLAPGGNTLFNLAGETTIDVATVNYSQENSSGFDNYVKSRVGISKTKDLTVDGHSAVELSYQNSAVWMVTVVINKNDKGGVKIEVGSQKVNSLEKILSTFKFL